MFWFSKNVETNYIWYKPQYCFRSGNGNIPSRAHWMFRCKNKPPSQAPLGNALGSQPSSLLLPTLLLPESPWFIDCFHRTPSPAAPHDFHSLSGYIWGCFFFLLSFCSFCCVSSSERYQISCKNFLFTSQLNICIKCKPCLLQSLWNSSSVSYVLSHRDAWHPDGVNCW